MACIESVWRSLHVNLSVLGQQIPLARYSASDKYIWGSVRTQKRQSNANLCAVCLHHFLGSRIALEQGLPDHLFNKAPDGFLVFLLSPRTCIIAFCIHKSLLASALSYSMLFHMVYIEALSLVLDMLLCFILCSPSLLSEEVRS